MSVTANGMPTLGLYGHDHKLRMLLGVADNNSPSLGLYDGDDRLRVLMGIRENGTPSLGIYGPDGKLQKDVASASPGWRPQDVDHVLSRFGTDVPPRKAVEDYLAAPGAKVWVISAASHLRTITTGAYNVEAATHQALEACKKQTNDGDCKVVMINDNWVGPQPSSNPRSQE